MKSVRSWKGRALGAVGALLLVCAGAAVSGPGARPAPGPPLLLLAGASTGARLTAVGERGYVLLSDDAGASWRKVATPTQTTLTGVCCREGGLGWAVGHDETILRTRDGGEHWEVVHATPTEERPLLDVWFRTPREGFCVGAYGLFLETRDGGTTWAERTVSRDDRHLNRIVPAGGGLVYVVGEAGKLLRSRDAGATWEEQPSPYAGSLYGGLSLGGEALLVFGLRGHVYRTEDGGRRWQPVETGTDGLLADAAALADGRLAVVGTSGAVLVSADRGRSFRLEQIGDRHGLSAVLPVPGGALGLGERGAERLDLELGAVAAAALR